MSAIATLPDVRDATIAEFESGVPDLDRGGLFEFIDGRLVEKKMGFESNWIAGEVSFFLRTRAKQSNSGYVLPEQTFRCFPGKPNQIRRPDIAFIAANRVGTPWPTGHLQFAPDIAVEVTSPNDLAEDLESRIDDYRSAGVPLVWVFFPHLRMIRVHENGGSIVELRDDDTLTAGTVLSGFSVAVKELFPPMPANA